MFRSKVIQHPFFYIGVLCALFLLMELIVNPVGNFPLNDEWLYSRVAFTFHETHVINGSQWGSSSMLAHIMYGNFFMSVFGLSYSVLHLFLFSALASRDYFSGQRAKWAAIHVLKNTYKIPDASINGGLEHESKVFFDNPDWFQKWNNNPQNEYLISYGNVKDYRKFSWITYNRVMPYQLDTVFILKRNDAD